jgi:predicted nucleic acid-binding protein
LDELERILVDKLRMPTAKARAAVVFVRELATLVAPSEPAAWPRRDPDDQWIVAAALEARVDVLVTGDRDLLDIAEELPIPTVSPRGFWEKLR